jgi:hypothetical protein
VGQSSTSGGISLNPKGLPGKIELIPVPTTGDPGGLQFSPRGGLLAPGLPQGFRMRGPGTISIPYRDEKLQIDFKSMIGFFVYNSPCSACCIEAKPMGIKFQKSSGKALFSSCDKICQSAARMAEIGNERAVRALTESLSKKSTAQPCRKNGQGCDCGELANFNFLGVPTPQPVKIGQCSCEFEIGILSLKIIGKFTK